LSSGIESEVPKRHMNGGASKSWRRADGA